MKRASSFPVLALGSVAYWITAVLLIGGAMLAVPGDCGLERTLAGAQACHREVRLVVLGGLAVAALLYAAGLWRLAGRKYSAASLALFMLFALAMYAARTLAKHSEFPPVADCASLIGVGLSWVWLQNKLRESLKVQASPSDGGASAEPIA